MYYIPPCKRLIRDYSDAKAFNRGNALNAKKLNADVVLFNKTLLNVFNDQTYFKSIVVFTKQDF